jgi:hypothetical protein
LSIGYSFPDELVRKAKLGRARIAIAGNNIVTLTKFIGLDPEISRDFENPTDRNMSPNITYLTAPQQKSYMLTLDIGF